MAAAAADTVESFLLMIEIWEVLKEEPTEEAQREHIVEDAAPPPATSLPSQLKRRRFTGRKP